MAEISSVVDQYFSMPAMHIYLFIFFFFAWSTSLSTYQIPVNLFLTFPWQYRLVGLVVKASASRAEGPGFKSRLRRDFFGVESYQWLKNWHSSGYPARRLAL